MSPPIRISLAESYWDLRFHGQHRSRILNLETIWSIHNRTTRSGWLGLVPLPISEKSVLKSIFKVFKTITAIHFYLPHC